MTIFNHSDSALTLSEIVLLNATLVKPSYNGTLPGTVYKSEGTPRFTEPVVRIYSFGTGDVTIGDAIHNERGTVDIQWLNRDNLYVSWLSADADNGGVLKAGSGSAKLQNTQP